MYVRVQAPEEGLTCLHSWITSCLQAYQQAFQNMELLYNRYSLQFAQSILL